MWESEGSSNVLDYLVCIAQFLDLSLKSVKLSFVGEGLRRKDSRFIFSSCEIGSCVFSSIKLNKIMHEASIYLYLLVPFKINISESNNLELNNKLTHNSHSQK